MRTILGVFQNREDTEAAIDAFDRAGYNPQDISIVMKDQSEGRDIAETTGASVTEGVATGAVLGGLAGLLSAIAIPGLGAFFIGGPLAAALGLTGAAATTVSGAATGAVAGGLLGALTELGVSDEDAKYYESRVREGAILVAVPALAEEEHRVREIFSDYYATDVKTVALEDDRFEDIRTKQRMADTDEGFYEEPQYRGQSTTLHAYGTKGGKTKKSRTRR